MKLVFLSDTHSQHDQIEVPEGDILIHCGDALGRGTVSDTIKFNAWLGALPHKYKIFVPGNHDELFEVNEGYARELMTNATVLIDEPIEIEGLKFYGSPWTPTFYNWNFMMPDSALAQVWSKIPNNLDVLITHGPPYGILDFNSRGDLCGSQTLHNAVIQKQPRIHAFGHIHEAAGTVRHNGTQFINAAVLDGWYNLGAPPQVVDLEPK